MFFSGTSPAVGADIEQHMQFDLLSQRHEWYKEIAAMIAEMFGKEVIERVRPGPDFHGRGLKVPVSIILDGYLLVAEENDPGDRGAGERGYTLLVACTRLHFGMVGMWSRVDRPADLKAGLRMYADWTPNTPESGGVIMALPAQTIADYSSWVAGWMVETNATSDKSAASEYICRACGYDMGDGYSNCGASEDGTCPECGWVMPEDPEDAAEEE